MNMEQLLAKTYQRLSEKDFSGTHGKLAIQVNLTGKVTGVFYIEILEGVLSVQPYEYYDRDAAISIAMSNFDKILTGKLDIQVAMVQGKLQVEGNLDKVLLLEQLLSA